MGCEFDGIVYGKLKEMQEARRAKYFELVSGGMNFTQAAEGPQDRQPPPAARGQGEAGQTLASGADFRLASPRVPR